MIKHQTYIPAFEGSDGGVIEKGLTLPQLAEAMNFYIAYHSEKTANYSIKVAGSGKLVIEQKNGSTIQTSEYWLADGVLKTITIQYASGKDVKLYGCITDLHCYNNSLTYLDVSHNPALEYLECYNNSLTSLDVSHNPALTNLNCTNNQLTSLDLSHNPALTDLNCSNNQLTSLDISHNPALGFDGNGLHLYGNPFWSEESIDRIIASLPDWSDGDTATFYYCDSEGEEDVDYKLTESQAEALGLKGWSIENNY